ncbi:High mobility group B protein 15 [Acorus calamus]|uniref:High mobility group B protein 15 n=1 Tax=Acorus calamus TaxID=4465 RepID=A0AAV9D4I5_ACOCL|nr:High mobility group B protein 15 [Acorus calamus]
MERCDCCIFFPPTITSASFALRKYYISLLHHYEQIYLFRHQDWPVSVTAFNPADAPASLKPQTGTPITQEKETNKHQLPAGHLVTGVIDGKFEHGYLVTVNVGSTKLRGVLYHVPQETHVAHNSASSEDLPCSRRSLRKGLRDPSHPKSNRSGYNFFFAEHYARLKPLYCGEEKAISKEIGQLWNNLTKSEKEFYEEKAMRDKERYRTEMLEYKKARSSSKYQ